MGAFGVAAAVGTFDVADSGAFVVADVTGAGASELAHASFILVFSTTYMDKLPP